MKQFTGIAIPKKEKTPTQIGALCAVAAVFAPLLHEICFFLISLPLLLAAFVLAIVSIVRGKVGGGVLLLAGLVLALPSSCSMMIDREKMLHHPEQLRMTAAQREAETQADSRDVKMNAEAAKHWVNIGMTMGQCRAAWGEPISITRTGSGDQIAEHWRYSDKGPYLYFENGILKSWKD